MDIGIIGAGNVGTGIGKRLAAKGHPDPGQLRAQPGQAGGRGADHRQRRTVRHHLQRPRASARSSSSRPLGTSRSMPCGGVAAALAGKVVWDTTNPLKPDMSGLELGTTTSAGEEVARAAPGARVVKAVPPFAEVLHSPPHISAAAVPACSFAGTTRRPGALILGLVADIDADGVDAGPLAAGALHRAARHAAGAAGLCAGHGRADRRGPAA